jgi:repressor LexA
MPRKPKGIGEPHKRILRFLEKFREEAGYSPSIREIQKKANISSTSVVSYYLDQLETAGYIERDKKVSRAIVLKRSVEDVGKKTKSMLMEVRDTIVKVPIAGRIVASAPAPVPGSDFSYYDADSTVDVAMSTLPARDVNELFALEVQGDSMIDAMVNDGDIVIMKKATEARNGEMVAVWLNDKDETTLKYFYKEKNGIRLQPANPTMDPIYVDNPADLRIQGKVVMVIRQIDGAPVN